MAVSSCVQSIFLVTCGEARIGTTRDCTMCTLIVLRVCVRVCVCRCVHMRTVTSRATIHLL